MKEFNTTNEPVFLQENTKSIISNTKYNVYLDKDFFMKHIKEDYDNGLNVAICSTRKDYTDYLKAYIFRNKISDCYEYIDKLNLDENNDYTIKTFKSLLKPDSEPVKYKSFKMIF